jgi:hypothetical protein
MDLQFIIMCVITCTSKLYYIDILQYDSEIALLVAQTFNDGIRITLPQILKWTALTWEVRTFFVYFGMDEPQMI